MTITTVKNSKGLEVEFHFRHEKWKACIFDSNGITEFLDTLKPTMEDAINFARDLSEITRNEQEL